MCSTARSSVTLMCSTGEHRVATRGRRRPRRPAPAARRSTSSSSRDFDRSTWRSAAVNVSRSTRSGSAANHARRSGVEAVRELGEPRPGLRRGGVDGGLRHAATWPPPGPASTVSTQLVPGLHELVDALLDQDRDHVVVVDAGVGQRVACVRRRRRRTAATWSPLISPWSATASHGLLGHRVDGVLDDQVDDVHGVAVVGVLHAGRGPQRPLRLGAVGLERGPAVAGEDLLVGLEGQPRVGDAGLALAAPGRCPARRSVGVEPLVDLGVDAGDEERRDRVDRGQVVAVRPGPSPGRRGRRPSRRGSARGRRSA